MRYLVVFLFLSSNIVFASQKKLQPLTINCSIFSHSFPELSDIKDDKGTEITFTDNGKGYAKSILVKKIKHLEFWVSPYTYSVDPKTKNSYVTEYTAEILDLKLGYSASANSDEEYKPSQPDQRVIKSATVALTSYSKELLEKGGKEKNDSFVNMHCVHFFKKYPSQVLQKAI